MHAAALEQIMGDTDHHTPINGTSLLEDDLALSSSTLGMSNKDSNDLPGTNHPCEMEPKVVYMNEDAMDCIYNESNDTLKGSEAIDEPTSPEMFGSDTEDAPKNSPVSDDCCSVENKKDEKELQAELMIKSDNQLLNRIHEALSGVPPPPSVTISRMDCADVLKCIKQNSHLFPFNILTSDQNIAQSANELNSNTRHSSVDAQTSSPGPSRSMNAFYHQIKSGSRNLMNAFNACDLSNLEDSEQQCCEKSDSDISENKLFKETFSDGISVEGNSSNLSNSACSYSTLSRVNDTRECKTISVNEPMKNEKWSLLNYRTIDHCEAVSMQWPEVYLHKSHGIHYNRSTAVEDFEYLTIKLCERYIGAETQSTCNIWFTKQIAGSPNKRKLPGKRSIGQSPGRRLSHLARRRRAFSSASLQGLGFGDKKQLMLDVKKPILKKGKSPRGKGVRGKSPRGKSPRSSAKKRAARRLVMEGPSPRKLKLETSKRALFQSPPGDKAGPSKMNASSIDTPLNPQRIRRALFPTPNKKDEVEKRVTFEDTRKRKNEEELEGPRLKWAKSLSFDCPRDMEKKSVDSWKNERHSTGTMLSKSGMTNRHGRGELTETHKKKLLWAVAEALRGKGIGMNHPQFKQYAPLLARMVKRFMPDLENKNIPRKPGSTSDRMLKFAKQYVLKIVDTKSTDC